MKKSPHTVRASLHRWQLHGVEGLWEAQGRGRKPGWTWEDIEFLEQCLKSEERTYNSQQLSQKLATQRSVQLSADQIRRLLKKKGWRWKRTRQRQPKCPNAKLKQAKLADLDWLLWAHAELRNLFEVFR